MSKQRLSTLPTDFSINSEDGGGLRLSKNTKIICDVDSFFMIKNENEDTSVLTQDERLYPTDPLPKETLPAVRLGNENQDSLDITPEKDVANVLLPDRTPIEIQPLESKRATLLELPAIEGPSLFPVPSSIPVSLTTQSFEDLNFLPEDENQQTFSLYDIIPVTDESVVTEITDTSYIYNTQSTLTYINNTGKATNAAKYYGDNVPYIKQRTNWGCLITCIEMLEKYAGKTTYNYSKLLSYVGSDNSFIFGKLENDVKNISRTRQNLPSQQDVFSGYRSFLESKKQPIIIRIAGISRRSRGHYVVAVGIATNGNLIVHNPSNNRVAFKDTEISVNAMLKPGEAPSGFNYDIIYLK